jgi:hypothetical protein
MAGWRALKQRPKAPLYQINNNNLQNIYRPGPQCSVNYDTAPSWCDWGDRRSVAYNRHNYRRGRLNLPAQRPKYIKNGCQNVADALSVVLILAQRWAMQGRQ